MLSTQRFPKYRRFGNVEVCCKALCVCCWVNKMSILGDCKNSLTLLIVFSTGVNMLSDKVNLNILVEAVIPTCVSIRIGSKLTISRT